MFKFNLYISCHFITKAYTMFNRANVISNKMRYAFMRINKYIKEQRVSGLSMLFMFAGLSMISMGVQANFATPNITSPDNTCPIDHKKYPLSNSSVNDGPALSQWKDKETSKSFSFPDTSTGNKELFISFTKIFDSVDNTPFYSNSYEDTRNSLNMTHNSNIDSSVIENHVININVNKPVSKIGYKIQDLDTDANIFVTFYLERAKAIKGLLSRVSKYHDPVDTSNGNNTVTTKNNTLDCGPNDCTIDAAWGYTPANTQVSLIHSNAKTTAPFQNRLHTVGYSDFYFCLAPPKIVVNKALNDNRVNPNDQFKIEIIQTNQPTVQPLGTFTTTGSNSSVNNNTTNAVTLEEKTNYTITERVLGGGDISRYTASYECTNATTGSPSVIPRGNMMFNANNNTRSFTLSNLNYADEITCTITNKPASYTFSGTVFNDNGGITNPDSQLIGGIYNNSAFFNGVLDANEAGIDGTNGVKARLIDCSKNPSTIPIIANVDVTKSGKYEFTVLPKDLEGKTDLCIEEIEPNNWLYSVDTTPNIRKFSFNSSVITYRTGVEINGSKLNLDFGNVIKENTALVLIKSQYVHDCSLTNLMTITVNYTSLPTAAYSKEPIANIQPGQCIAYRIEAINRGNVSLTDVVIKDILQKRGEDGALIASTLVIPPPIGESSEPTFPTSTVALGDNRIVITNGFNLGTTSSSKSKAIRFNTKYGNTMNP